MNVVVNQKKKEKLKPDYSRAAFVEEKAPWACVCSCPCSQAIERGQVCFSKPYVVRGKLKGHNRLVSMDHYDDWLESVAKEYVKTIIKRHPETEEYFR